MHKSLDDAARVKSLHKVINYCHKNLFTFDGKQVLNYLTNDRKISLNTIKTFKLGCFPQYASIITKVIGGYEAWSLKIAWFDKETCTEKSSFCSNRLIIPYFDEFGVPLGIVGRTILEDESYKELGIPKYVNSYFDKRSSLFGLNVSRKNIRDANEIIVVEGNFDMITSYQSNIRNVVAAGHATVTFPQLALASRYANKISLCLDNDEVGRKSSARILENYASLKGIELNEFNLPANFKDFDEYLNRESSKKI